MRAFIEKQTSDGSEHSGRSSETPPKRKWPGRITSKLSIALEPTHTNQKTTPESLTARSESSSDKSLSCSSLDSAEEEEEVGDWFAGNEDEEVEDWLAGDLVAVPVASQSS
jgi:hypothetical protein